MAEPVGELGELAGGAPVRVCRQPQMRDWIAFETISPALQQEEFRLETRQVLDYARPNFGKRGIGGTRGQRYVELGASGAATPRFSHRPGAGIQIAPIFMDTGNNPVSVTLERVKH